MCLAQGRITRKQVSLEPMAPWSQVKHSPTEPLIWIDSLNEIVWNLISWFQQAPADLALNCFQNGSFEHPKHMLKLMGKKIFIILRSKFCLSKPIRYLTLNASTDSSF